MAVRTTKIGDFEWSRVKIKSRDRCRDCKDVLGPLSVAWQQHGGSYLTVCGRCFAKRGTRV